VKPKIAFFTHDSTESTVRKRVNAFQANGAFVFGLMFRRSRGEPVSPPNWSNVDLGETLDRNYLRRLPKLAQAILRAVRHRHDFAASEVFYARNIDMLFVAAMARWFIGSRALLAYEVLDIQRAFVGSGWINRVFRWLERRLLRMSYVLVVSSPDFMTEYFFPKQGYGGRWYLLENKILPSQMPMEARKPNSVVPGPPWTIGWFGALRCARSLEILGNIADALGDSVQIHIRGRPSESDLPSGWLDDVNRRSNMTYFGPYVSPHDLPEIYRMVHFSWSIDYLDAGTNSDWLLPNRIYEGGLLGAIALTRQGTAAGRFVERTGLGVAFPEPLERSVVQYLRNLDAESFRRAHLLVKEAPRSLIIDEEDTAKLHDL
jgi:hypothetical protein